jgi:hypothetical protein
VLAARDGVEFVAEISITTAAKEMNQHGRQGKGNQHLIVTTDLATGGGLSHEMILPNGV